MGGGWKGSILGVLAAALAFAAPAADGAAPSIDVEGNQLVDTGGGSVRLLGVNRSGTEYACSEGWGFFDSPHAERVDTPAMVGAIADWGATAVRVSLNEACWLGINGVKRRWGGKRYREAITTYVERLEAAGLNPILDLHQVSPKRFAASHPVDHLRPMPDHGHAIDFWRSVARRFGADRAVVFDLYNEPHDVGWRCLRDGCRITKDIYEDSVPNYRAVGMQELVNAVRGEGAENVLMVAGIDWSGDLSRWLEFAPHDPLGRIAASFHNYEGPDLGTCHLGCWEEIVAPVAAEVPVVTGEMGDVDCDHDYIDGFMDWADERGISYLGWSWVATGGGTTCRGGPSLIKGYDGTPTGYGLGLRDHLQALGAR